MTRTDKKTSVDNLTEETEQAAGRLYSIDKTLNGKCTRSNVKDKAGKVLSEEHEKVPRWKEDWEFTQQSSSNNICTRYSSGKRCVRHQYRLTYAE